MKTHQKILIGGLGALTPVIVSLLVVDLEVLLLGFSPLPFLGYFIRAGILFYLGGLVAYLHKDEKSPIKLFELGIVAPALITSFINASRIEVPNVEIPQGETRTLSLPKAAWADVYDDIRSHEGETKTFSLPQETPAQKLWRGFTTSIPEKVWFVIVGSHLKFEDARQQAGDITDKGFKAEVYAPYGDNPYYAVVIGANLTYREAQRLRKKAIEAGLPRDTYPWRLE